jgi:5,5'-dehydrodivanillate O-demethylase
MVLETTREETIPAVNEMDVALTGPGTLMGRFMRCFWHPVGVSGQLSPGRALPFRIMNEDYTLYRGESGEPHVVAFRCAHRGTQLSTGWVEGDQIRCFYHGWKYGSDGQCTEQPAEPEPFCRRIKIASYPTYEYLGLIFAYFGEGDPPPRPRYPELEDGVVVTAGVNVLPYNYLNNLENSIDTVHVGFVHRRSNFYHSGRQQGFGAAASAPGASALEGNVGEISCEETEYGFIFRDTFENGSVRVSHFEIPNVLHIKVYPLDAETGWRDLVAFKVPQDDHSYRNFSLNVAWVQGELADRYRALLQAPRNAPSPQQLQSMGEDILAGKLTLTPEDVGELAYSVNLQDYVAQRGQGIIADRIHERLGHSDRVIMLWRTICRREMQKLANGQPLKEWRWPGYLITTTGAD